MNKKISLFAVTAASCLLVGSSVQAAQIIERRVVTQTQPIQEREIITERVETRMMPETRRGTLVSGETLAGRREVKANDVLITPSGDGHIVVQDGNGTRTLRTRGQLNAGETDMQDLED